MSFLLLLPLLAPLPSDVDDAAARADLETLVALLREEHPAPYRVHGPDEWDAAVERAREALGEGLDLPGVFTELERIVALAADGHTRLEPSPELRGELYARTLPLRLAWFEEGLFVTAAPEAYGDLVGARVRAFGERSAEEAFRLLEPYLSADNEHAARLESARELLFLDHLERLGLASPDGSVELSLAWDDGSEDRVLLDDPAPFEGEHGGPPQGWVDVLGDRSLPPWLANRAKNYWFEPLADGHTLFVQFNSVRDAPLQPFAAFCDEVFAFVDAHGIDRLVLDLRFNGGGNNYLNQPLVHGLVRRDALMAPGGLFVLTSPRTFSAAMCLAGDIEANTHALFVGDPTGSGPNMAGDTEEHELPHTGFVARISALWWQRSDPRDERRFIVPDVPVPMTFADVCEGRDAALEAALAWTPEEDPEGARAVPPNTRWYRASQTNGR